MSENLMKVSSQGVRDFKVKGGVAMNDDIGDVYKQQPINEPPHFDTNKQNVSKPLTTRKKKLTHTKQSVDIAKGQTTATGKSQALKARKYC